MSAKSLIPSVGAKIPVDILNPGIFKTRDFNICKFIFCINNTTAKIVTWNFHVDDSQGYHRYNMILVCEIFSELNIDLCFYNNTIRGGWSHI